LKTAEGGFQIAEGHLIHNSPLFPLSFGDIFVLFGNTDIFLKTKTAISAVFAKVHWTSTSNKWIDCIISQNDGDVNQYKKPARKCAGFLY